MQPQDQQHAAFVLHSRPYRETSLLVDLFVAEQGRLSVVARGARRPGSSLRQALQPFNQLSIRFRGRDELKTLLGAEIAEHLPALQGRSLLCGLYANELLQRLLQPLEAMPRLFLFYRYLLNELISCEDLEGALRTFEHQLLKELGVWDDLNLLNEPYYQYNEEQGWVALLEPQARCYSLAWLREIEADRYIDANVRKAAKHLMRTKLNRLLGDKPLRSRALFERREKPQNLPKI
ncbi:MAG TPA: DNA repair protein RecO [Marinobacterium sp.]|nr:DNA repair protein RecO [Marinobacterium sp.]